VVRPINKVVEERWARDGLTPAFAAPFVTLRPWEWHLHAHPG
jgi:hypothetical protein